MADYVETMLDLLLEDEEKAAKLLSEPWFADALGGHHKVTKLGRII